jgi:hypothetical protein
MVSYTRRLAFTFIGLASTGLGALFGVITEIGVLRPIGSYIMIIFEILFGVPGIVILIKAYKQVLSRAKVLMNSDQNLLGKTGLQVYSSYFFTGLGGAWVGFALMAIIALGTSMIAMRLGH